MRKSTKNKQNNYYVPLSDKAFNDIKSCAIEIWKSYDDTYGYATEKIDKIKDIFNIKDNGMYIVAMFDNINITKLLSMLMDSTLRELLDGRLPDEFIGFVNLLLTKNE